MVEITNWKVCDLCESVIACRNSMRTTPPEYTQEEFDKSLPRAIKLAQTNSAMGEDNFLCRIRVAFDIKYPNYFSPELQRKAHRLREDWGAFCKFVEELPYAKEFIIGNN